MKIENVDFDDIHKIINSSFYDVMWAWVGDESDTSDEEYSKRSHEYLDTYHYVKQGIPANELHIISNWMVDSLHNKTLSRDVTFEILQEGGIVWK